jgi:hypothetical protein
MPKHQYAAYCKKALQEDPRALRWVDPDKVGGGRAGPGLHYVLICEEAVAKNPFALEHVQAEKMPVRSIGRFSYYFNVCMKAAMHEYIGAAMQYVKDELLTDAEYIQVCLEAVLHGVDIIRNIKHERLSREDYLKICWVSAIRDPRTVNYMHEPTPELRLMAARAGEPRCIPEA